MDRDKQASTDMCPVGPCSLSSGNQEFVGVETHASDILGVAQVVPLALVLHVVQDHHGCNEVSHLACWEEVEVSPGVSTTVAVHPFQLQLARGCGGDLGHAVGLQLAGRTDQVDRPTSEVEPDDTLLC